MQQILPLFSARFQAASKYKVFERISSYKGIAQNVHWNDSALLLTRKGTVSFQSLPKHLLPRRMLWFSKVFVWSATFLNVKM
jgi:hypothetical protein